MTITTGTVKTKERINNSTNGNPRYFVIIETKAGETLHGNTQSDASYCYGNWKEGENVDIKYHFTKTGRFSLDSISRAE